MCSAIIVIFKRLHQWAVVVKVFAATNEIISFRSQISTNLLGSIASRTIRIEANRRNFLRQPIHVQCHRRKLFRFQHFPTWLDDERSVVATRLEIDATLRQCYLLGSIRCWDVCYQLVAVGAIHHTVEIANQPVFAGVVNIIIVPDIRQQQCRIVIG